MDSAFDVVGIDHVSLENGRSERSGECGRDKQLTLVPFTMRILGCNDPQKAWRPRNLMARECQENQVKYNGAYRKQKTCINSFFGKRSHLPVLRI